MGLNGFERFEVKTMEICANGVEHIYYPLLYKRFKNIDKQRNIRYAPNGKRAKLDIFTRADGKKKKPLFIYVHGGGWVSGVRGVRRFYCYNYVDKGYVSVNIDYDYALAATHPEHLRQIFKGIEYVLDRADELGIDASRIVVAGESSGGFFAGFIGAIASHKELYDKLGIEFRYKDEFMPAACLLICGIYDPEKCAAIKFPFIGIYLRALVGQGRKDFSKTFTDEYNSLVAPLRYADGDYPPSFVIAGDKDPLRVQSETFAENLRAAGVDCDYFLCTGINGLHAAALDFSHGKSGKECFKRAFSFVDGKINPAAEKRAEI